MSREIKFRAWDHFNQEMWHSGDSLSAFFKNMDYFMAGDNDIKIMQFTSLHDCNGKEIYEGDIVNIKAPSWNYCDYDNEVIRWDNNRAGFLPWTECSGQIDIAELASSDSEYIEIIGNIYENPELLK